MIFFIFNNDAYAVKRDQKSYLAQCLSSREYITTTRFLTKKKEFSLNTKQIEEVADLVSKGCTGASKRFIIVTNLLVKTGLDTKSSIKMAMKFAGKTEKEVKTFTYIFKRSYLKKYLDLSLPHAIEIAFLLADKFDGNHLNSQRTFNQVLRLCNGRGELDMPNMLCANLAARVAKSGENFSRPLGDGFRKLFQYLIKRNGPNLAAYKAIELTEKVMKYGPTASRNFIQAYQFAISKKGLNVAKGQAISFGEKLAQRTLPTEKSIIKK